METRQILIDQRGNRFRSTSKAIPHAVTHEAGGSDALTVQSIGGLSSSEIYRLFRDVETSCSDYTDFYKLLKKYCPLGPTGKIPSAYLPVSILQNSYIEYVANFPGTLKTGVFDLIPIRHNCILHSISATLAEKPVNGDTIVSIRREPGTLEDRIETPEGQSTYNAYVILPEDSETPYSTGDTDISGFMAQLAGGSRVAVNIDSVGADNPGEFLTVRILTKLIT